MSLRAHWCSKGENSRSCDHNGKAVGLEKKVQGEGGVGDEARKAMGERGKGRGGVKDYAKPRLLTVKQWLSNEVCFRCNFLLQISPPTTRGFSLL